MWAEPHLWAQQPLLFTPCLTILQLRTKVQRWESPYQPHIAAWGRTQHSSLRLDISLNPPVVWGGPLGGTTYGLF